MAKKCYECKQGAQDEDYDDDIVKCQIVEIPHPTDLEIQNYRYHEKQRDNNGSTKPPETIINRYVPAIVTVIFGTILMIWGIGMAKEDPNRWIIYYIGAIFTFIAIVSASFDMLFSENQEEKK